MASWFFKAATQDLIWLAIPQYVCVCICVCSVILNPDVLEQEVEASATIKYRIAQNIGGIKLWRNCSTCAFGRANLVSVTLPFNALIMFGWENLGEFTDNCQIHQCFPPPTFCAIWY